MSIGRNDPCPCGSGKKYKKCCLQATEQAPSLALYYQRLSRAHDRLINALPPLAIQTFGQEVIAEAFDEFMLWPENSEEITEEIFKKAGPLFFPWFFFNWEYDRLSETKLDGPEGKTLLELYIEKEGDRLDPLEDLLIRSVNRKPNSFWEVISVDKGTSVLIQDIFTGTRIQAQEYTASRKLQPHDIIFGRAVDVDGVGMLLGVAPTIIPPGEKPTLIELRKQLSRGRVPITDETLYDWDYEIRKLYFDIEKALFTPPKLHNSDGHPLEFHRLVYEITSAEEALGQLGDLCLTLAPEELSGDAKRNRSGRITEVEFSWDRKGYKRQPGLTHTTLGHLLIKGNRLTAEVNSAERAEELRRKIDARLKGIGRFKMDEIQDMETLLSQPSAEGKNEETAREHEELMQKPEVQEYLAEVLLKHWEYWVNQKLPILGGKTPKKAVKTTDGREAVEALLNEATRDRGQDPYLLEGNRKGVQRVREILGLKTSPGGPEK
ncbi:MAG: DUF2384 domain-containing protein [Deltaproteobacteria bacterium]|nr:DUF2384 domain-containing protein [Deltaproteobacteria bacterium]